jgi:hypothetical protein
MLRTRRQKKEFQSAPNTKIRRKWTIFQRSHLFLLSFVLTHPPPQANEGRKKKENVSSSLSIGKL